jgi:prepilin-type N-terminal cleavage/methylation domain-containing protein
MTDKNVSCKRMKIPAGRSAGGFTLIECVIAMVVGLVGLLAIYTLIFTSVQIQTFSRNLSVANSFARAKVEELKNSSRTTGGNLDANTSGYFDLPSAKYIRRWQITNDPMGTQTVQVRVIQSDSGPFIVETNLVTRMN